MILVKWEKIMKYFDKFGWALKKGQKHYEI